MEADSEGQRSVPNLSPLALTWALTWGSLGADLGFTWGSLGAHLVKGGSRKDAGHNIQPQTSQSSIQRVADPPSLKNDAPRQAGAMLLHFHMLPKY